MRKQYKEVISDFRFWDQKEHACEYILYPENLGEDLSLDETCLSNGEVYTILTNKAAHGRKGALVAMIKGVDSTIEEDIASQTTQGQDNHHRPIFGHDVHSPRSVS